MSSGGAEAIVALGRLLGPTAGRAAGLFFRSFLGMFCLGVALTIGSVLYAASVSTAHGVVVGLITLALAAAAGFALSVKRAVTGALSSAIDEFDLGSKTVDALFAQVLDVDAHQTHGERGVALAQVAENLPLHQAEERLSKAVVSLLEAPSDGGGLGGWLRRKLLASLLHKIETLTLAEFRSAGQGGGGVDLIVVRDQLGEGIDTRLTEMTSSTIARITALFVIGLIVLVGGSTWGICQLPL